MFVWLEIAAKFVVYLGVLTAAGTVIIARVFGADLGAFRATALRYAILGLVAALFVFSLRGAALTGDAGGMIDPDMLGLLWSTPVGTALALRVGGLVLLISGLFVPVAGLWLAVAGGVVAVWSFGFVGHVPDQMLWWLNIALMLHLLGIAFWVGILTPLQRLAQTPGAEAQTARLGHRFGQIAAIVVLVLIIAGVTMAYVLTGSFGAILGTGYGRALLIKIMLVASLLILAAINKLRFVPKLRIGKPGAGAGLVRVIQAERLAILATLLTTAVLTTSLSLPV